MFLVAYDIADDKVRTKFSKFLSKFGYRLQYSIFEIRNSDRVLDNIRTEINNKFLKLFKQSDSVIIFDVPEKSIVETYGYARNEKDDFFIVF